MQDPKIVKKHQPSKHLLNEHAKDKQSRLIIVQEAQQRAKIQEKSLRDQELVNNCQQKIMAIGKVQKQLIGDLLDYQQLQQLEQYSQHRKKSIIAEKQLNKKCTQCKTQCRGFYYVCLVCKQEVILCDKCERKEDIISLKSHPFSQHPFAKIKRWTQQIKSIDIQLEQETQRQQSKVKEKQTRQLYIQRVKKLINDKLYQILQQKIPQSEYQDKL